MSSPLPIEAAPAWVRLNNVNISNVNLQPVQGKGLGFVATKDLADNDGNGTSPLLYIPRDTILSADTVEEYAKVDANFRELLDKVGRKSPRTVIMLYLLVHYIVPARAQGSHKGIASTPWTEYTRFLPRHIPIPTLWSEEERLLLRGTSLEAAVTAKSAFLVSEFDELSESCSSLPFWQALLLDKIPITIKDWALVDAWYRSRCLELPIFGDSMVPFLDMVNHSHTPNAYYEVTDDGDVALLRRPECAVSCGEELVISYGDGKQPAEMLFSYGFIDQDTVIQKLVLPLSPLPDDPLGQVKFHVFNQPPLVQLTRTKGAVGWDGPLLHLMCVNEEDGLEFSLAQDVNGEKEIHVFWEQEDMTDKIDDIPSRIEKHELYKVFQLRAVSVLQHLVETQLEKLQDHETSSSGQQEQAPMTNSAQEGGSTLQDEEVNDNECAQNAHALRNMEGSLLKEAEASLADQHSTLLNDSGVKRYLGLTEDTQIEQASADVANEEPDFS